MPVGTLLVPGTASSDVATAATAPVEVVAPGFAIAASLLAGRAVELAATGTTGVSGTPGTVAVVVGTT
jgi:hypothetical protein